MRWRPGHAPEFGRSCSRCRIERLDARRSPRLLLPPMRDPRAKCAAPSPESPSFRVTGLGGWRVMEHPPPQVRFWLEHVEAAVQPIRYPDEPLRVDKYIVDLRHRLTRRHWRTPMGDFHRLPGIADVINTEPGAEIRREEDVLALVGTRPV